MPKMSIGKTVTPAKRVQFHPSISVATVLSKHLLLQEGQTTLIWYSREEYLIICAEKRETIQKFDSVELIFDAVNTVWEGYAEDSFGQRWETMHAPGQQFSQSKNSSREKELKTIKLYRICSSSSRVIAGSTQVEGA
jgi:hypothetical protein